MKSRIIVLLATFGLMFACTAEELDISAPVGVAAAGPYTSNPFDNNSSGELSASTGGDIITHGQGGDDDSDAGNGGDDSGSNTESQETQVEEALTRFKSEYQAKIDGCNGGIYKLSTSGTSGSCVPNSTLYTDRTLYSHSAIVAKVKELTRHDIDVLGIPLDGGDNLSPSEVQNYDVDQVGYLNGNETQLFIVFAKIEFKDNRHERSTVNLELPAQ